MISTKTGVNPVWITEAISETQVKVGTMISPKPEVCFKAERAIKLAEEPEFTNILYFVPNHFDHSSSKAFTFLD